MGKIFETKKYGTTGEYSTCFGRGTIEGEEFRRILLKGDFDEDIKFKVSIKKFKVIEGDLICDDPKLLHYIKPVLLVTQRVGTLGDYSICSGEGCLNGQDFNRVLLQGEYRRNEEFRVLIKDYRIVNGDLISEEAIVK